ncbi:hypothetical protein JZ751_005480 [Albula glossodonta]|uniref:Uncharacterized protein n=1 Tax=Albula glossodonta TaxID=121402 RepID=A0A8T2N5G1_9TELE|nr:hypothetical protein JZ751_005480 [Albula glossodonta]
MKKKPHFRIGTTECAAFPASVGRRIEGQSIRVKKRHHKTTALKGCLQAKLEISESSARDTSHQSALLETLYCTNQTSTGETTAADRRMNLREQT